MPEQHHPSRQRNAELRIRQAAVSRLQESASQFSKYERQEHLLCWLGSTNAELLGSERSLQYVLRRQLPWTRSGLRSAEGLAASRCGRKALPTIRFDLPG